MILLESTGTPSPRPSPRGRGGPSGEPPAVGRPPSAVTILLSLLQLSDSFFPSGMFAHSLGIEPLHRRGRVTRLDELEQLIAASLAFSVIPADGIALHNAHRAALLDDRGELVAMDSRLLAMKAAPELRQASQQQGRRLLAEAGRFSESPLIADFNAEVRAKRTPGTGAVSMGIIGAMLGIGAEAALAGYLHGYCTSMASAAIRLLQVSNTDCQAMLFRLHAVIAEHVAQVQDRHWRDMSSFTPELDIASMQHAHDDLRMFAS